MLLVLWMSAPCANCRTDALTNTRDDKVNFKLVLYLTVCVHQQNPPRNTNGVNVGHEIGIETYATQTVIDVFANYFTTLLTFENMKFLKVYVYGDKLHFIVCLSGGRHK